MQRKKHPHSTNHNLKFKCIDARFIKLEEKFDLIFSNEALHWIKNHGTFVKNIIPLLTNKGTIVFRMVGRGATEDLINVLDEVKSRPQFSKYFTSFEFMKNFE
ncbi:methyltransferase domain-containing protein [Flavivirga aquimarina]|uniref:Methyltransferase domain-containing protein n=1 Tax=Flavivirga aquimarina TaxID=2027862 RepID=A0ABT8W5C7_9FLAO|nr:methyltransferase domain-containing protein [Flavivirga aquimarina]MDO5968277.1 methyltransferase domain-containing protein [Flavivirga aquimarina]